VPIAEGDVVDLGQGQAFVADVIGGHADTAVFVARGTETLDGTMGEDDARLALELRAREVDLLNPERRIRMVHA
jgi:hypothetical protein